MNNEELRNSPMPRIWDNTMLCMLDECPRKLYYFLRGFDYAGGSTPAYFTFGRAFHEAMHTWHAAIPTEPGSPEHIARQLNAIAAAEKLWLDEGTADNGTNSLANLKNKLATYFDEYPTEEWSFVPHGGEAGWVWPLSEEWELGGAMDGYVFWPERGFFVLEHKTTGEYLHQGYVEQFFFSRQITQYYWYLCQLHKNSGETVYGALVNMVTKNIKGPKSKWNNPEFDRLLVKKASWQLQEFEEDVLAELALFKIYWQSWYWPRKGMKHPATCTGGPGKSPCLFRGICKTPLPIEDVHVENFVGITTRTEAWQPWKRLEES